MIERIVDKLKKDGYQRADQVPYKIIKQVLELAGIAQSPEGTEDVDIVIAPTHFIEERHPLSVRPEKKYSIYVRKKA